MRQPYAPLDDALFRRMMAGMIDGAYRVEQDKSLYEALSFKMLALHLSKRLGLTMSYALVSECLER